jgi:RecJ-like exonuclease
MKRCPFCGGEVRVAYCDEEGEEINELGYYGIVHSCEENKDCPIASHKGESLGVWLYDTEEEAIEAWNSRI